VVDAEDRDIVPAELPQQAAPEMVAINDKPTFLLATTRVLASAGMASSSITTQPPESPAYHAFDSIPQAAIRGEKMVKSLLNFARQSPIEKHELDMNVILREEVNLPERTTLAKNRLNGPGLRITAHPWRCQCLDPRHHEPLCQCRECHA
jgi:hypothetical protein